MGFFKKLFKKGVPANIHVNARVMPITRGDMLEDPYDEEIKKLGLGQVTGAGTGLDDNQFPAYCDIELELNKTDPESIQALTKIANELGFPIGSYLELEDQKFPLGVYEGAFITCDTEDAANELIDRAKKSQNENDQPWQYGDFFAQEKIMIALYGPSFEAIQGLMQTSAAQEPALSIEIKQLA